MTKEERREYSRTRKYRRMFPSDAYALLLAHQAGKCAICRCEPNGQSLAVDHCHNTGNIRGLLCSRCNIGIGYFKDNAEILCAAAAYVMT